MSAWMGSQFSKIFYISLILFCELMAVWSLHVFKVILLDWIWFIKHMKEPNCDSVKTVFSSYNINMSLSNLDRFNIRPQCKCSWKMKVFAIEFANSSLFRGWKQSDCWVPIVFILSFEYVCRYDMIVHFIVDGVTDYTMICSYIYCRWCNRLRIPGFSECYLWWIDAGRRLNYV